MTDRIDVRWNIYSANCKLTNHEQNGGDGGSGRYAMKDCMR